MASEGALHETLSAWFASHGQSKTPRVVLAWLPFGWVVHCWSPVYQFDLVSSHLSGSTIYPKPSALFRQRFGHSKTSCRSTTINYARCSESGHEDTSCTKPELCYNCKGNHSASSKSCPKWTGEKRIQSVRVLQKKSYQDARKVIEARTPTSNSSSYSSAVKTPNQIDSQPVLVKHKVSGVSSVINPPDGKDKTITVKMSEYLALLEIKKSWEESSSRACKK
ncbi:hypothetical protein AVEN_9903-1 [Araneus ventricosus]|uniref:Uncharacterized protein n=1 Tax=Araneus ventricosus TaxID=182803 RepID=A0A4Y2T303_ARAVE|nr:hypothetical protein AVEN_9903-1 [Araneus ventricosus]